MHRCSSGIFAVLAVSFALVLSACTGNSTPNSSTITVEKVTLTPTTGSIDVGATLIFSASATDSKGQPVFSGIQFVPGCGSQQPCAPLSVSSAGLACAGSWDSLSNPVVCTPGTPGFAQVTAVVSGVSSPPATVYIHQHIDNIQITPVGIHQCSTPPCTCFSQGETFIYQAKALSNGNDITSTVGPLSWTAVPLGVVAVNSGVTGLQNNQAQTTARVSGVAQLFASVSGVTSTSVPYTTCLVKSIMLNIQGDAGNQVSVNPGGGKAIEATVLDTMGNTIGNPPLTWITSDPEIASFTSAATITGTNSITTKQSAGGAVVSAVCAPATCNLGVLPGLPVYSSGGLLPNGAPGFATIKVSVTTASGNKPPTFNAFAATTMCGTEPNCSSVMFPVSPSTTPIGASILVPRTPNSMLFTPQGTRIYIGSDDGLMFYDVSGTTISAVSTSSTPCEVALCGRVLAISPDGNRVVVSDNTATIPPHPSQVYIYDNTHTSTPAVLPIAGATAAAFSPDEMKVFVVTDGGDLFVYSTVDSLLSVPISTTATDVAFSADGSFAFVAGTPNNSVSGFATCNGERMLLPPTLPPLNLPGNPLRLFPLPNTQETPLDSLHTVITQQLLALEPPNLQLLNAQYQQNLLSQLEFTCQIPSFAGPPSFTGLSAAPPFNLGQGNFVPLEMRVVGDGSQAILVAQNIPAVFVVDVNAKITSAIPLVNNASPSAASVSPDGTTVFVTSCDGTLTDPNNQQTCGTIHIVDVAGRADIQQGFYTNLGTQGSMCNNLDPDVLKCLPDLIAVRPQ